jgi:acyl-CoA reductase-like NAD-dependent aldehyde dehydrogenase
MSASDNNTLSAPLPLWIDGKEASTSITFDVYSPSTGDKLWTSCGATATEATQAVESAQRAFKSWRKTKPAERRQILLKAADIMETRRAELKHYMAQETGALEGFSEFNVSTTIEVFRNVAGLVSNINGVIPQTQTSGTGAFVFKEPYGVIYGMAPWNAPYILGSRAFLYAIAAGNTCVFKGSELSPRTAWALGSIMHEAGLPAGVLNVIYHSPQDAVSVTNTVIEHAAIKKINFTGSTAVGSILSAKAGKELKPVLMELGGKASAIVCEDADIEKAAMQCALGSFFHAGQICMATERILVHKSIIDKFAEALKVCTEKVYPPSAEAPVLIAKAGAAKNKALREDAEKKGAKVVYGEVGAKEDSEHHIRPAIFSGVTKDMDIFYTESFGPTVSLIEIESDEQAIEIANDTDYGLSGAVFTESLGRGLRIAREIDSGAVHINSMTVQ